MRGCPSTGGLFGKYGDIREKLIRSDKLEAVIALAGGVFYSTPVSACILFLNNKKKANHIGRVCLIDGSEVFTAQRSQNYLSEADVKTILNYYLDYEDVIEKVKIVTISDLEKGGFELSVKKYIEHEAAQTVDPEAAKKRFLTAMNNAKAAEEIMKQLLTKGGYTHE